MSGEQKKKISQSNIGKKMSLEARQKMSRSKKLLGIKPPSRLGSNQTDYFKSNMSERMRGNKNTLGHKLSLEHKRKIQEGSHKGEKNKNWKGGVTPENHRIRNSMEYKLWRKSVFERDDYTCIWCGQRGVELNADHIKPFAYYPELRFELENGRTLCLECHKKTDNYGKRKKI